MSDALVIGYGSIGRRHARLLAEMGLRVTVVSGRDVEGFPCHRDIGEALRASRPGYVVIASTTDRHLKDLHALANHGFDGTALVEKPLFMTLPAEMRPPPFPVFVAYNLRFHPVAMALKAALAGRPVLVANAFVGQHLSQWRPGRVVAETYSAHVDRGGGVVRDLSHEFDLAGFLFGPLTLIAGHSARVGAVTVDSEDAAAAIFEAEACRLLTVQINYLDHTPRRRWIVITEDETLEADLVHGTLTHGGEVRKFDVDPDESYRAMHAAALAGGDGLCDWAEGTAVVALADRIAPR